MTDAARIAFFDALADRWDGFDDQAALAQTFAQILAALGVGPAETVLDLGAGTGNLARALLTHLGPTGRVVAVDQAPAMVAHARAKLRDPRAEVVGADVHALPLPSATFDRAICAGLWPHLACPAAAATEIRRVLKPGGQLHVLHTIGRARVNAVHAAAGPAVANDHLPPAAAVAALLAAQGFAVHDVVDDDTRYLVTAAVLP